MHHLVDAIIEQLQQELGTAIAASQQAHASATDSENIAENKYDTLAVEAAYLAHGQSLRIAELQQAIRAYQRFKPPSFTPSVIQLGKLVGIEDEKGKQQRLFIGPAAGGLSIKSPAGTIQVITPATPLGQVLMDKSSGDDVEWQLNDRRMRLSIVSVEQCY